jgi:hypothetical protein
MSQLVGKQIADNSIEQTKLNLSTPTTGDTAFAATVGYVNGVLSGGSFSTVIGPAEKGGYTDGIFTDFTNTTPIGTAVDRFNEILLLLAPTPPSSNWNNVFSNLIITDPLYSGRNLSTGAIATNISVTSTPTYILSSTVSIEENAKSLPTGTNTLSFTLSDTSVILKNEIINSGSTGMTSGIIQYTVADPYFGISGKAGFWSGITSFTVGGTLSSITPSSTQRILQFNHVGIDSPETFNYYIDSVSAPSITNIVATLPSMTRYISGIPSLAAGVSITNIGFNINNAVSYFYNNNLFDISGTLIVADINNPPTVIPTTQGQIISESNLSTTVTSNSVYDDDSFQFNIIARNIAGTTGTGTYTFTTHRIDLVSNESIRRTSGSGSYPSTGYNNSFDSTQSLVGTYTEELMLRNGIYQYPAGNYTTFGGPNYSSATGTRWVTFNLGTFTNNSAFSLNFIGSAGITSIGQSNLLVEVKIEGATYWVDGDAAYSGVGNPGSTSNGVAAVVIGSSTATTRRITFGSVTYSGSIIVRVGITNNSITFTSLTATSIS